MPDCLIVTGRDFRSWLCCVVLVAAAACGDEAGVHPRDAGSSDSDASAVDADIPGTDEDAGVPGTDDDAGPPGMDDDAGPPGMTGDAGMRSPAIDGDYRCAGKQALSNDCTAPWVDSAFAGDPWSLTIQGDELVTRSIGFDQREIRCEGQWSDAGFECAASWSRAGRQCESTLHLRSEASGEATFWVSDRSDEVAGCTLEMP